MMAFTYQPVRSVLRTLKAGQDGFTVVEIIVAMFILVLLAASLGQVVVASNFQQSKAKVRQKQLAVGEAIFERVQSEPGWATPPAGRCSSHAPDATTGQTPVCDLTAEFKKDANNVVDELGDARGDVKYNIAIAATGFDSTADGRAAADKDSVLIDYYRVNVEVTANGTGVSDKKVVVGGIVDSKARVSGGSLSVQICAVTPQVDERIAINSCDTSRSTEFARPSDTQGPCTASAPYYNYDCPAWGAARFAGTPRDLSVEPMPNSSFQLRGPLPAGANYRAIDFVTNGQGRWESGQLAPGRYIIVPNGQPNLVAIRGYKGWPSKSVPGQDALHGLGVGGVVLGATVEAGKSSKALHVYVPRKQGSTPDAACASPGGGAPECRYRVHIQTTDITDPRAASGPPTYGPGFPRFDGSVEDHSVKLIPAPVGRASLAKEWSVIRATHSWVGVNETPIGSVPDRMLFSGRQPYVDIKDPHTGLYAPQVLRGPGGRRVSKLYNFPCGTGALVCLSPGSPQGYLWLSWGNNSPATTPTDGLIHVKYCNDNWRAQKIASECDGLDACWWEFVPNQWAYLRTCSSEGSLDGSEGGGGA